ncbi:MAG: AbrB/MazE/SpoVT family DNA-binding domain-containing protein [Firmicutes bacterium]|nr:AbrB/MazE/SpoVT family DNA-binding domain-containing protein [Bacillota bacterium]MCL5039112.1 AbrB/MazE/SpoVT family DNA-binding domain-containing protein [Bacillota bacterium]
MDRFDSVDSVDKGIVNVESGRLEIPELVWDRLRIRPGDYVVLSPEEGHLVIRKVLLAPQRGEVPERKGGNLPNRSSGGAEITRKS